MKIAKLLMEDQISNTQSKSSRSGSVGTPQLLFPSSFNNTLGVSKPVVSGSFINHNSRESIPLKEDKRTASGTSHGSVALSGVTYSDGENLLDMADTSEDSESENESESDSENGEDNNNNDLPAEKYNEKGKEPLSPESERTEDINEGVSEVSINSQTSDSITDKKSVSETTFKETKVDSIPSRKKIISRPSKERVINRVQVPVKSKEELKQQEKKLQNDRIKNEAVRNQLNQKDPNNLPFDFQRFLKYLKSKNAESIRKYLKSFLIGFSKKIWTVTEQVKLINDFKIFIYNKMTEVSPFSKMNETEFINCQEGIEKFVMNRLYDMVFSPVIPPSKLTPSHKEDTKKDELLTNQILRFTWINNKHLDLDDEFIDKGNSFLKLAINELIKINNYRSPRDKIICILNCCKVSFAMLKNSSKEMNADSFIPTLIYVVLKTDEDLKLNSNLGYIERFRNEEGLTGEVSYYLSSFWAVIGFIENLNKESLTITQEEWDLHMKAFEETKDYVVKEEGGKAEGINDNNLFDPEAIKNSLASTNKNISQLLSPFQQSIQSFFQDDTTTNVDNNNKETVKDNTKKSKAEILGQKAFEKEIEDLTEQLTNMFPDLDQELIHDIVIMNKARASDCVDACLNLAT